MNSVQSATHLCAILQSTRAVLVSTVMSQGHYFYQYTLLSRRLGDNRVMQSRKAFCVAFFNDLIEKSMCFL